jgi:hypothetical protein
MKNEGATCFGTIQYITFQREDFVSSRPTTAAPMFSRMSVTSLRLSVESSEAIL